MTSAASTPIDLAAVRLLLQSERMPNALEAAVNGQEWGAISSIVTWIDDGLPQNMNTTLRWRLAPLLRNASIKRAILQPVGASLATAEISSEEIEIETAALRCAIEKFGVQVFKRARSAQIMVPAVKTELGPDVEYARLEEDKGDLYLVRNRFQRLKLPTLSEETVNDILGRQKVFIAEVDLTRHANLHLYYADCWPW